jgi:hypothetical protein
MVCTRWFKYDWDWLHTVYTQKVPVIFEPTCTINGKLSHFCMGWAQSVQCAVMQHTMAVGCLDVRPVLTNTCLVNPPIEPDVCYPVGSVTKKTVLLPMEPTIRVECLLFKLALLSSVLLFKVRRHSPALQCHAEPCVDHQTVTDWSQFCRKAMSNFLLSCSLQLFLWGLGGWQNYGNIWELLQLVRM